MKRYWKLNTPSVYKGLSTTPGGELSEVAIQKLGLRSKNDKYVTNNKPKVNLVKPDEKIKGVKE